MSKLHDGRVRVWNWRDAIRRAKVAPLTKHVCNMIANYVSDVGDGCYPSIKTLKADTGLSNRTLATHLEKAREAGLLIIKRADREGGKFGCNHYYPCFPQNFELSRPATSDADVTEPASQPDEPASHGDDTHQVNLVHSPGEGGSHKLSTKNLPSNPPLPPKGGEDTSASRANGRKRSPFTAEQTKLTENAFALWNEIAPKVNGQRVKAITGARRRRMLLRLDEIGGIDQFAVALSAIERVPFLMGKVPPKPGQAPFKLDIDRLLQTDGNLGDVLAKLIDKAGDESDLVGPNGKRWGWWRGKEADYRAMPISMWRDIDAKNKPNGTWPWWAMGPPPGHRECIMPEQLVAERGYLETYRGQANG